MLRRLPAVLLGVCIAALWGGLAPDPALAHGFGQRYDLPVPLWLYITGAGAAVALSFAVIGVFMGGARELHGYPRLNLLRWRVVRAAVHPAVLLTARVASVLLLVLVVAAGLIGDQAPASNLAPILVWVIWWVGLAYVSALVGDVWGLLNPWKAVFGWAEGLYRRIDSEGELSFHHRYPPGLDVWPGVLLLAAFAWVELVYADSAAPLRIAQMAGVYSVLTWGGMLLFGREQWVRHAEVFSLAFGLLARFAPTEVRVTDTTVCGDCRAECRDLDGQCIGCCDCYERAPAEARELNLRPLRHGAPAERSGVSVPDGLRLAAALNGDLRRVHGHAPMVGHRHPAVRRAPKPDGHRHPGVARLPGAVHRGVPGGDWTEWRRPADAVCPRGTWREPSCSPWYPSPWPTT